MLRPLFSALFLAVSLPLLAGAPASAQVPRTPAPGQVTEDQRTAVSPLLEALGIQELLEIMREEGLAYSADLEADMFPGRGGSRWPIMAAKVYALDRMETVMLDAMAAEIDPAQLAPLLAFFRSDLGQRIVGLEVSARRAFLDPSVEEAGHEALAVLRQERPERYALLEDFARANDLIEMNVVGALNSNYAFYGGLNDAGAFGRFLAEDEMLRDVWAQEESIREETEEWVYAYLAMAYEPLSDAELGAYIELSRSPAGRTLNTSLFAAFDVLFQAISRDLGMLAAQFMSGEDI